MAFEELLNFLGDPFIAQELADAGTLFANEPFPFMDSSFASFGFDDPFSFWSDPFIAQSLAEGMSSPGEGWNPWEGFPPSGGSFPPSGGGNISLRNPWEAFDFPSVRDIFGRDRREGGTKIALAAPHFTAPEIPSVPAISIEGAPSLPGVSPIRSVPPMPIPPFTPLPVDSGREPNDSFGLARLLALLQGSGTSDPFLETKRQLLRQRGGV